MATHSSILTWEIPWTGEPGRLQFKWSQGVWHDLLTKQQQWSEIKFLVGLCSFAGCRGECILASSSIWLVKRLTGKVSLLLIPFPRLWVLYRWQNQQLQFKAVVGGDAVTIASATSGRPKGFGLFPLTFLVHCCVCGLIGTAMKVVEHQQTAWTI